MHHIFIHALPEGLGQRTGKRSCRFRRRHRMVFVQILCQKNGVDTRGIAPDDAVLIGQRDDLRLVERSGRQDLCNGAGLPDIVQTVCHTPGGIFRPLLVHGHALFIQMEISPVLCGDTEMFCNSLESVSIQIPADRIVEQSEMVGIRNVPAEDVIAGVIDGAFCDIEAGGAFCRSRAVTPESEFDFPAFRPGFDVRQIKTEKIVTFHNVRVPLLHDPYKFRQQLLFGHVLNGKHTLPAGVVRHPDDTDGIAGAGGIGKIIAGFAEGFNVDLHPADFIKPHAGKKPDL